MPRQTRYEMQKLQSHKLFFCFTLSRSPQHKPQTQTAEAAASPDTTSLSAGDKGHQQMGDDLSKTSTSPEGFDANAKLIEKEALIEQLEEEVRPRQFISNPRLVY